MSAAKISNDALQKIVDKASMKQCTATNAFHSVTLLNVKESENLEILERAENNLLALHETINDLRFELGKYRVT